jgi:hypothetical protein
MPNRKTERWSRDPWRVGNLSIPSSSKILPKGFVRLLMDHSRFGRLSGPEKWWSCNDQRKGGHAMGLTR